MNYFEAILVDTPNDSADQIKLRTYSTLIEAESARAYLEAHGVAATLPDRHAIALQPHLISILGGVRLTIAKKDEDKATALLHEIERRSHLTDVSEDIEDRKPQVESLIGNRKLLVR